jgi:hypothetical protein
MPGTSLRVSDPLKTFTLWTAVEEAAGAGAPRTGAAVEGEAA